MDVSIHAPTRGATSMTGTDSTISCFNPRAHAGRDRYSVYLMSVKSAFQSTRPRGARHMLITICQCVKKFQSTRPRGARRMKNIRRKLKNICFNPRAHAGRDKTISSSYATFRMFQSTRPRGARHGHDPHEAVPWPVSIHAPTRGATVIAQPVRNSASYAAHSANRTLNC